MRGARFSYTLDGMAATRSGTRLRVALFLAVGMAMTGLGLVAYGTNVFRDLDLQSVDARFSIRGDQGAPTDIVVVKVDDETFSALQTRWEDFRPLHAQADSPTEEGRGKGDRLRRPVHRAVAKGHEEDDNKLINAVGDAGNVVLATTGLPVIGDNEVSVAIRPESIGARR